MSGLREEITKRFLRARGAGRPSTRTHSSSSASDETSVPTDPREGRQFGSYRVLRRLGSGGMGHVYLALDTRLGRHTALKFLPPELLSNKEMLNRLQQEARTASALNHPNILTIYEIGEVAGEPFIASEFVDGVTSKRAIQRRVIDPDMAIRIAAQIASALAAAHSAGVIHRDLKPANVMLRPDGYVKVIDFGLAKIAGDSGIFGHPSDWSVPGAVVGTVDYMSPEQARGDEVDLRTDLWSLGILLYEMLSNQRPFSGETDSHVIVAILDRPAPALQNAASFPAGVGAIIARALTKDVGRRYQSAQQMLADLEQLDTSSMRRRSFRPPRAEQGSPRRKTYVAVACVGLLVAAAGLWWWDLGGKDLVLGPDWFRVESVTQVTFNGRTLLSAISPDGKYLAFVVGDRGGMESLHLKQVDQPSDEVRIPVRRIDYLGLTFSPDSRTIYEVEEDQSTLLGKLFAVPVVGERASTPILEDIDGPVTFSPNGDRFAFVRWEHPSGGDVSRTRSVVEVATVASGQSSQLFASTKLTLMSHLAWAPRKDKIAAIVRDAGADSGQLELLLLGPDKRQIIKPFPSWSGVGQLWWQQDGRSLVLTASSKVEAKSRSQVREFAVAQGVARDVVKDLSGYGSVSMTASGKYIAAVRIDPRATLWLSAANDFAHGQSTLAELQDNASLAWLDREHLLVNSRRAGFPNLAVLQTRDQSEWSLTHDPSMEQHAQPVPGGESVVYSSNRAGGFHIWRYDLRSNRYRQLTFGSTYDDTPVVSPDGKWIIYTSWSSNNPLLFKVALDGGQPIALGTLPAADAQISPDGNSLACRLQKKRDEWSIAIMPVSGTGQIRPVSASIPFCWSKRGDALTSSITDADGVSNVWRIPLDGSPPGQLTHFEDQSIQTFAWSPDGNRLACVRLQNSSDVVLFQRQGAK